MKKVIEYQICYDVESTVSYLGEENPGEHYFKISTVWVDGLFDAEEEEAFAIVNSDGEIVIEAYEGDYLREEAMEAIVELMKEIIGIK